MTSRQVECGKTENGPSHQSTALHARRSTRNTKMFPAFSFFLISFFCFSFFSFLSFVFPSVFCFCSFFFFHFFFRFFFLFFIVPFYIFFHLPFSFFSRLSRHQNRKKKPSRSSCRNNDDFVLWKKSFLGLGGQEEEAVRNGPLEGDPAFMFFISLSFYHFVFSLRNASSFSFMFLSNMLA